MSFSPINEPANACMLVLPIAPWISGYSQDTAMKLRDYTQQGMDIIQAFGKLHDDGTRTATAKTFCRSTMVAKYSNIEGVAGPMANFALVKGFSKVQRRRIARIGSQQLCTLLW